MAGRFEAARRRPGLSFSHHAELAGLAPEDQELWLDGAEAGGLSVRSLRAELRRARVRAARRTRREAQAAGDAVVCPHCEHRIPR